jgi:predicted regulator of Ras-like GTPase activity (Roadblock/LC7/MglB family)
MSKVQELENIIQELRDNVPDISGIMIATNDGLAVASDFPEDEGARIAAVGAAASGLGGRIAQNAALGEIEETMVRGSEGMLLIYVAGDSVLAVRAPAYGNLGLVRLEANHTCKQVKRILGQSQS